MMKKATGFALLACSVLFGFSLASGARAADVEKLAETCANCHGKDGASTGAGASGTRLEPCSSVPAGKNEGTDHE